MKHLLALLVLALTSPAFAAESNGSQYQWQTPAGKWEVTPELSYGSSKTAFKPSGDDTSTGLQESVLGEYGINEMFSAGLKLTASSVTTTHTAPAKDTTQSGLHDLIAFFHGRSPIGEASLRYGVDVNFGLDKQELDATNTYVTNNSSGGMGAKPWVGYEMGKDNCLMGAQLSYKMYMGRPHSQAGGSCC